MVILRALLFGWTAGLAFGLFDATIRISRMLFDWYEIYLALLLPGIVLATFFAVIACLGSLSPAFRRNTSVQMKVYWSALVICTLLVIGTQRIEQSSGRDALWVEAYIFLTLLGAAVVVLLRNPISIGPPRAWLANARLFMTIFLLSCLAYDLTNQSSNLPVQEIDSANSDKTPVILLTLDTVRARSLGTHGQQPSFTPHLDTFAEESIVFERAYSTSSWTLPSHASMFTGKWIYEHGAHTLAQQLSTEHQTLAELLKTQGYRTGGFVGGPYAKARYGLAQGFEVYSDRLDFFEWHTLFENYSIRRFLHRIAPEWTRMILKTDGEKTADELMPEIYSFLQTVRSQPFFLFVNFFDAHAPYNLGEKYREGSKENKATFKRLHALIEDQYQDAELRFDPLAITPQDTTILLDLYHSELSYLDAQLASLFQYLKELGLYDKSLIIITSDHGEEFLEHGGLQHRQTLFEEVVHVPLFIKLPKDSNKTKGVRISTAVSNKDIFDTTLNLTNTMNESTNDLLCLWKSPESCTDQVVLAELYGNRRFGTIDQFAAWQGDYKLLMTTELRNRLSEGLFELVADPAEQKDLSLQHPAKAEFLFTQMPPKAQADLVNRLRTLPWMEQSSERDY